MSKCKCKCKQAKVELLELTPTPPKEEGFYWYAREHGEHTPTVLCVQKDYSDPQDKERLWASDEEFCFQVPKKANKEDLWARVPDPSFKGKRVVPRSW